MVRINLVAPKRLTDQHLNAEYVEIKMLAHLLVKHPYGTIPEEFTLGKGHMSFFKNKVRYIYYRYLEIVKEMVERGINVNYDNVQETIGLLLEAPIKNFNNYTPTKDALNTVKSRILDRVKNPLRRKKLYTYYGKPITFEEYQTKHLNTKGNNI